MMPEKDPMDEAVWRARVGVSLVLGGVMWVAAILLAGRELGCW